MTSGKKGASATGTRYPQKYPECERHAIYGRNLRKTEVDHFTPEHRFIALASRPGEELGNDKGSEHRHAKELGDLQAEPQGDTKSATGLL